MSRGLDLSMGDFSAACALEKFSVPFFPFDLFGLKQLRAVYIPDGPQKGMGNCQGDLKTFL